MNEKFSSPVDSWIEELRAEETWLVAELARVRRVLAAADGSATTTGKTLRAVTAPAPERVWSAVEVKDAMEGRGWATPSGDPVNVVRAALVRAVADGWVERVGRGGYRLVAGGAS